MSIKYCLIRYFLIFLQHFFTKVDKCRRLAREVYSLSIVSLVNLFSPGPELFPRRSERQAGSVNASTLACHHLDKVLNRAGSLCGSQLFQAAKSVNYSHLYLTVIDCEN